jgi:hypothetical protein
MAYFITASASASVIQTTFDTTGSIVTSSLGTSNNPVNVSQITYLQKGSNPFPNLSRPVYKYSLSFQYDNQSINWLYNDTASRDSDFDLIKNLDTKSVTAGVFFVTSSASASVIQTTFDTTGSIVTSSLYTSNNPINLSEITYIQKSSSPFPNLSRPVYKPSVSFVYIGNGENKTINWLYDTTSSRDTDFEYINSIKLGGPRGNNTTIQYNDDGRFNGSDYFNINVNGRKDAIVNITGSLNVTDKINLGDVSINPSNQTLTTTQNYVTSSVQGLFYSKLDECRFPSGGSDIDLLSGSTSTIYGSRNIPSTFFSQSGDYKSKVISLRIVGSDIFGNNKDFNSYIKIGNDVIPTTNTSINVDKSTAHPFEILTDLVFNNGELSVCSSLRYCDNNFQYFTFPLSNLFETTSSLNLSGDIQFWVSSSSTITEMTGSYAYIEFKN